MLPIRRKTLFNQSINKSINQSINQFCITILYFHLSHFRSSVLHTMKKTDMTGFAGLAMLCVLLFISSHFIYAIYLHILTLGLTAILTIVPSITTYWADPAPVKTSSDLILLIGTILIFLLTIVLGILVRFFFIIIIV